MRRIALLLLLLASIMVLSTYSYAQDPYYTTINKASGLPSNSIYDLFQDTKGFIWIANNEGLTRYDGFEYKTYTSSKQTSRAGNDITEDKYGRIWYKNFDGYLYYVDKDTLRSLKQNTTIGNSGYAIINDHILVPQINGIDIFDLTTLKIIKNVPFNFNLLISELHYKDHYYILTAECLNKINAAGDIEKHTIGEEGLMSGSKNGIVVIKKDNEKKYCFEIAGDKTERKIAMPDVKYIQGVDYCDGLYWLFTPNGVWAYDEQGHNINNGQPFFPSKNTSCVLKDREGNYWFGTLDGGIIFVPDLKTKLISLPGFAPNTLLTENSIVYTGTKDNTIYACDPAYNSLEQKYKGAIRHEILFLKAGPENKRRYISAEEFIVFDKDFHVLQRHQHAVKDISIIDDKYLAYAASGQTGLLNADNSISSEWDSLFTATQIKGTNISQLMDAGRGRTIAYNPVSKTIYTGSNKGLYCINRKNICEIKLRDQSVYSRTLVSIGDNIYMLTSQQELYIISAENKIRQVHASEEKEQFLNIRKAGNKLFLLTTTGIKILDTATGKFNAINLHPGIRTEEINDIELVNDQLVIASDRGLIFINNASQSNDTTTPGFTINTILVNGNKVQQDKFSNLSHTENDIDICYSILSFNTARRYQLFYKINDGKWQVAANATRNLKLASLSPGAYNISFELRADDGNKFPQQVVIFTINKPFWAEWWFWAGCIIILTTGGYSYYKWQTNLLNKKNALVLEKVELEKNLRNSMLTSIRAQMNPHFFYNALNSIQSFIFFDDKRSASTYLVKLSRLTRMILEMSEKESISLDEETEALKLYLELEKMRFSTNFNYEIRTGNNVESELIKIPSMIVQPYVENAIKHGLLHKKGERYLSIEFIKDNGNLSITIDDNGIGREKAGELNKIKKEKHHPFSTEANSKRIELLNKERSKYIGVVYIDKKDENEMPAGTTVIISIPLI